jgi:hypothetical protein
VELASAGNFNAPVVLVGEGFAERKDLDPWYQWPFASFNSEGCSKWLTDTLDKADVRERDLCWVNADQELDLLELAPEQQVLALGVLASAELYKRRIRHVAIDHPQYHKRFKSSHPYPLIQHIYNVTGA